MVGSWVAIMILAAKWRWSRIVAIRELDSFWEGRDEGIMNYMFFFFFIR
jgi:hypothetical protein